jgi:hypothetical protein
MGTFLEAQEIFEAVISSGPDSFVPVRTFFGGFDLLKIGL